MRSCWSVSRTGTYPPGEKLPADDELCREFSVIAITVKKALEMLAESGCVKRVPGNGSFVRKQEKAGGEKGGKDHLLGLVLEHVSSTLRAGNDVPHGLSRQKRQDTA